MAHWPDPTCQSSTTRFSKQTIAQVKSSDRCELRTGPLHYRRQAVLFLGRINSACSLADIDNLAQQFVAFHRTVDDRNNEKRSRGFANSREVLVADGDGFAELWMVDEVGVDLYHQRVIFSMEPFPFLPVGIAIIIRQLETLLFQYARKLRLGFGSDEQINIG